MPTEPRSECGPGSKDWNKHSNKKVSLEQFRLMGRQRLGEHIATFFLLITVVK